MKKFFRRMLIKASDRLYKIAITMDGDEVLEENGLLKYPECLFSNSKAQTLKNLSERLEDYIESRKLYLDPYLNLSRVAALVGSNRTYVSNILSSKKGFKTYLNELRFKSIYLQIEESESDSGGMLREEERTDASEYAYIILKSGFADIRTFRRQLSIIRGEWASRLRNMVY